MLQLVAFRPPRAFGPLQSSLKSRGICISFHSTNCSIAIVPLAGAPKGGPGLKFVPGVGNFFLASNLDPHPHHLLYIVILHVKFPFSDIM